MGEFNWIFEEIEKAIAHTKEYSKDKDNLYVFYCFVVFERDKENWHSELWEKGAYVETQHFFSLLVNVFSNWLRNKLFDYYSLYDFVLKAMIIAKREAEGELDEQVK